MTFFVAADLHGRKINLEFPTMQNSPSLHDVIATVESTFQNEALATRPPTASYPSSQTTFKVGSLQLFNEHNMSWEQLQFPQQILERTQLYVVQANPQHTESQEQIPVPRKPSKRVAVPQPDAFPLSPNVSRAANLQQNRPTTSAADTSSGTTPRIRPPTQQYASSSSPSLANSTESLKTWRTAAATAASNSSASPLPAQWFRQPLLASSPSNAPAPGAASGGDSQRNATSPTRIRSFVQSAPGKSFSSQDANSAQKLESLREKASTDEKVRLVFYFLDKGYLPPNLLSASSGGGVIGPSARIGPERFANMFHILKLGINHEIVDEIFRRSDVDHDGSLSLSEMQQLALQYPTLLDSLFYRLVDGTEFTNVQRELKQELAQLSELAAIRSDADSKLAKLTSQVDEQRSSMQSMEHDQMRRSLQERELRQYQELTAQEIDHEDSDIGEMQRQIARMKDDWQAQQQVAAHAKKEADAARQKQRETHHKLVQCESNIARIRQMLQEAELEYERVQQTANSFEAEVTRQVEAEQNAAAQCDQIRLYVEAGEAETAQANSRVFQKRNDQSQRAKELAKFAAETMRHQTLLSEATRSLDQLQDRQRLLVAEQQKAAGAVAQQDQRVSEKEQQLLELTQKRAVLEQKERPLLEQEILLKEQRARIEDRELKLRRDAGSLYDTPTQSAALRGQQRSLQHFSSPATSTLYSASEQQPKTLSPTRR